MVMFIFLVFVTHWHYIIVSGQNLGDSFCQLGSVTFRGMSLAIHKSLVSPRYTFFCILPACMMCNFRIPLIE